MSEDKAKDAVQARLQLTATLAQCATALQAAGDILNVCALELAAAAERENEATTAYVAALEKQISQQQSLS